MVDKVCSKERGDKGCSSESKAIFRVDHLFKICMIFLGFLYVNLFTHHSRLYPLSIPKSHTPGLNLFLELPLSLGSCTRPFKTNTLNALHQSVRGKETRGHCQGQPKIAEDRNLVQIITFSGTKNIESR